MTSTEDALTSDENCMAVQIFPNPFQEEGRIMVQTTCIGQIKYKISDILGRTIDLGKINGDIGLHDIIVDGSNLPSGSYVVTLEQGNNRLQKQMLKVD